MTNGEILGKRIYELRKEKGLSQEALADKLGVSRQAISKWECGEALPDTDNLISISRLFGVSLDTLVGNEDIKNEARAEATAQEASAKGAVPDGKESVGGAGIFEVDDKSHRINEFSEEGATSTEETEEPVTIVKNGQNGKKRKSRLFRALYALPYPILTAIAFLLWGFLGDAFHISWTLFVTIPVYYSLIDCIRIRKLSPFAYPVFVAFIYLLIGMAFGGWHPWWIIFITIPVYYSVAEAIDRK